MSKNKTLAWAYSIISEHVEKGSFGTVTIAMANGNISAVKSEINQKPPLDQGIRIP